MPVPSAWQVLLAAAATSSTATERQLQKQQQAAVSESTRGGVRLRAMQLGVVAA